MSRMKTRFRTQWPLPPEYRRLQRRLAAIGYLTQGSVFQRRPSQQGSRYVWTRKVRAKTVTVALSKEQYQWLRRAVANQQALERWVAQMQKLSRRILFETVAGVRRRKSLSNKVLGLI
jgi:virulence-associated protein VapD